MNTFQLNFRWLVSMLLMMGCFHLSAQDPCASVSITGGNGSITVGGLNGAPVSIVQAYNSNWQQVFNCSGNCTAPTQLISSLPAGQYFVKVDLLTAAWAPVCQKEGYFTVTGTGGSCSLTYTSTESNKVCNNNGTPNNPSDDTWTVNFNAQVLTNPNNFPVWGWNSIINGVGVSGMYGTPKALGPFPISAGNQSFVVNDDDNPSCKNTFTIVPPATCSNGGGTPTVSISDVTVNENAGTASLQICASATALSPINVQYATSNGSAASGSDYTATSSSATIPAGQTCVTVTFPIVDDANNEATEAFNVSLTGISGATIADGAGTVTILDNDNGGGAPNCNSITFTPGNGNIVVGGLTAPIVMIQAYNASWAPVFNQTYMSAPGSVTIPGLGAGTYYVKVDFFTAQWGTICSKDQYVTVGGGAAPTVSISDVTVNENAGTASLQICASSTSSSPISVQYTTSNGTAASGTDYNTTSSTATIPAGQTCVTVTFPIVDDGNNEPTEVFNVILSNPSGATIADGAGTVTILDNDNAPAPTVSINDVTVNENAGTASLQICASSPSNSPISVQYTTSNGTAASVTDYNTTSSTATIPAGQTCVTVTFPIVDDSNNEPTEAFNVVLSNPSGATIADGAGTVTILDNDAVAGPNCNSITFTPGSGNIVVGGLTAPISIIQAYNSSWAQVFNQNYTTAPGTVTIPGLTSGTYYVKVDFFTATWNPICTKEQYVTVVGGNPAVLNITCPVDVAVTAAQGATSAIVNYTAPTASTTCAGGAVNITRTSGLASGSSFPVGTTQVCYSATDNCGNIKSCCFTVTVTAPAPTNLAINCPANVSVTAASGANTAVVNYTAPTASTTCAGGAVNVTRTSGLASGSAFPVGSTQVCYQATDNCGNVKSCCFTVTVAAGGPVCTATRTVTNSKESCGTGTPYGFWMNVDYPGTTCKTFAISNGVFTENANGTAKYTAVATNTCNANIKFNIDADFCGRTYATPAGSPKIMSCFTPNTSAWYYYTTTCGTLTGTNGAAGAVLKVTRRGEAFQVGVGANLNEHVFGGGGWLNLYVQSQPTTGGTIIAHEADFNFNLSGTPTAPACGTGTANCSTIACFTPPAFPNTGLCYRIVNKASGKVLDADYSPNLQQWAIDYTSSQRWKFESAGSGYFFIKSQATALVNKVIDIANGSTADGAFADLVTKTGAECEQYRLQDAGNGYYYIVARHSGKALKLATTPGVNGTHIIQQTINSTNEHQKWQIVAIDCNTGLQSQQEDLTFNAYRKTTSTQLKWLSNTGDRNDYFVVERSADDVTFEAIAMVQGEGAKDEMLSFEYKDARPLEGDNFYRLRLVFNDGVERYSEAIKVNFPSVKDFGVFPNPASDVVMVELRPFEGEAATLTLVNQLGAAIRIINIDKVDSNPVEINLNGLENGFYTIDIQSAAGVKASRKLIINQGK
jgi:hypothetical protein